MKLRQRSRTTIHTNIAPLVDVVFLLLLFFMVTSRIVSEPAIEIKLPESKTAVTQEFSEVVVSITKEKTIYIGKKAVAIENILNTLKGAFLASETKFVKIKADQDTSLALLVKVVDEVKLSGAEGFSIVTEKYK